VRGPPAAFGVPKARRGDSAGGRGPGQRGRGRHRREEAVEAPEMRPVHLIVGDEDSVRAPLTGIATMASAAMRTLNPRCAASRTVVSQHIWVMKPEMITCSTPWPRRCCSIPVLVNEPGRCLAMMGGTSLSPADASVRSILRSSSHEVNPE
jgi:hypothetical protein